MFPFVRAIAEMIRARSLPKFKYPTDTHVSHHICWPWDLDLFLELNNGRTLTLLDIGRFAMAERAGIVSVLRREGWGLTMAGVSVRYRRRIRGFERFEVRSRAISYDEKFVYIEQSIWKKNGECATHALYRSAITDKNGIVPPSKLVRAAGHDIPSPPMPEWVTAWCEADGHRPWPPMQHDVTGELPATA